MLLVIIIVAIASAVDGCYMSIPREFHKIHPKLIWAIVTAAVVNIGASFLMSSSPAVAGQLALAAIAIYFVFRGIAFIGLDFSFRAYGRENGIRISTVGSILAWLASLLDALFVFAILVFTVVQSVQHNGLTASESTDCDRWIMVALAGGLFITAAFLLAMNSNRNRVAAFERAERKKKIDSTILERKKLRVAGAAATGPRADSSVDKK